jgi:glycosyltransferase involved in cell wall biosynthesis
MNAPAVSIVVATYNRSNVLELAIACAVAQTFEDWEMLVVGDACTDDSEQVVARFDEPRIVWENLAVNHGDQSGPNNHGVERSRGRYVAFLNQDDLWFPDHLERCLAALRAAPDAGGVFSPPAIVAPGGRASMAPSWTDRYESNRVIAPASGWLLRRATIDSVGPWRRRHECFEHPSRDWMTRALRQGVALAQVPYLTVLTIPSGARPRSYADRDDVDQRRLWNGMQSDPAFREELLAEIAIASSAELIRPQPVGHATQAAKDAVVSGVGARWYPLKTALKYRRKGGLVDDLRRIRGLPPHENPS